MILLPHKVVISLTADWQVAAAAWYLNDVPCGGPLTLRGIPIRIFVSGPTAFGIGFGPVLSSHS